MSTCERPARSASKIFGDRRKPKDNAKKLQRRPSRIDSIHVSLVVLPDIAIFHPIPTRERERLEPVIGPGEGWSRNGGGGGSDGRRQERQGEAQQEEERHGKGRIDDGVRQMNAADAALLLNLCMYLSIYGDRDRANE